MKRLLISCLAALHCCIAFNSSGQEPTAGVTIVKGVVVDAATNEPLPLANVVLEGTQIGAKTDFDGKYYFQTTDTVNKIVATYIGYKSQSKPIETGKSQTINFKLILESQSLQEVIVKAGKRKYKNKNNPAVQLIDKVIEHKSKNRKEGRDYYEYEKYEKVQFALSNLDEKYKHKKFFRKFQFIFENIDTTSMPGKEILPLYLKETLSDVYYRKQPKSIKEIIKANKMVTFEGFDNEGIASYMKYLYLDINIYDNNITILTNQFLSPIAGAAPTFYRYYIADTVEVDGTKCTKLSFFPRNKSDLLLQGDLYITFDTAYAVKKVDMTVSSDINLNWVKELKILQEFSFLQNEAWMLTTDQFSVDLGINKNGRGLYGQRTVSFKNYLLDRAREDSVYSGLSLVIKDSAEIKTEDYWKQARHTDLSRTEKGVYTTIDSLHKIPAFRRRIDLILLILAGYKDFGDFEIGPVNTFYSYNPVEGVRARFGGRTTKNFSKKLNFETYAAYGFLDEQWKYYIGTTYALGGKSFIDWPVNTIKFSYQQETRVPGQELQFIQEDNILLSIKRGENTKLLYNKIASVEYTHEFVSHFSYSIAFKNLIQSPGGTLFFNPVDYYYAPEYRIDEITTSDLGLKIRYAPNEQFYQGKNFRIPMFNQYPIFELRLNEGVRDLFGGDYAYHTIAVSVFKRFMVSPIGYTDVLLEGGQLYGNVPYPLLFIARANQTYSLQLQSYNLMNFLEFVSDRYVSLSVYHFFNGFFFNKIPLLRELKWREVLSAKVLYGDLRKENNPSYNSSLFKFPVDNAGIPTTYILEGQPYIEVSAGIVNIFKLFRVELIKRLTYLDHPGISHTGIRARFKFDF